MNNKFKCSDCMKEFDMKDRGYFSYSQGNVCRKCWSKISKEIEKNEKKYKIKKEKAIEDIKKRLDKIEKVIKKVKLDELKKQIKKLEESINYLKAGRAKIEALQTKNVKDKQKKKDRELDKSDNEKVKRIIKEITERNKKYPSNLMEKLNH